MEESKILSKYFPKKRNSKSPFYIDNPEEYPKELQDVLDCFKKVEGEISTVNDAVDQLKKYRKKQTKKQLEKQLEQQLEQQLNNLNLMMC